MYKLRELERKDIATINKWRNDEELISHLGAPYRFINMDVDNNWYENYMNHRNNTIRCSIVTEEDDIIGLVTLADINNINKTATLHIMIGQAENRGKGIGKFAVDSMLKYAFMDINLNRVELQVLANNERARKLYENVGFKKEGTKRKACFKNGQYVDMDIMGILKEEFLRIREGV